MPEIVIEWEKLPPLKRSGRRFVLSAPLSDLPSEAWREQLQSFLLDANQEPRDPAQRTWLRNPAVREDGTIEVELPSGEIPASLRPYLDDLVRRTDEAVA